MPVTGTINLNVALQNTVVRSFGTGTDPVSLSHLLTLASGLAAGQVDRLYAGTRQLAASANEDLDLAGSALTDITGAAVAFARVKVLIIRAAVGNTNNVVVGAAASNAWAGLLNAAGTFTLRPGEVAAFIAGSADADGHTVTPATGDLLRVANSGAGSVVNYDILIAGDSA